MMVKVAVPEKFKLRIVPNVRTVLFGGQQEIHYIGGSEVLPPPLENEKEREAYVASLIFFDGLNVLIALIRPMVPIEIKSSTPTPVLSNFFAI